MPQIIPALSAFVDNRRQALTRQLADALSNPQAVLAQLVGNQQDTTNAMNAQTSSDLASGNYTDLAQNSSQGVVNAVPGGTSAIEGLVNAARMQLLPTQLPVFERILAATGDPTAALASTKQLTNLMAPTPQLADYLRAVGSQ